MSDHVIINNSQNGQIHLHMDNLSSQLKSELSLTKSALSTEKELSEGRKQQCEDLESKLNEINRKSQVIKKMVTEMKTARNKAKLERFAELSALVETIYHLSGFEIPF